MSKRTRVVATFALKCVLLLLACSVFSWGLQAKLSLYKTPQTPSTEIVAKLLTERRSAQTMALFEKALEPDTDWKTSSLISPWVAAQAILTLIFVICQIAVSFSRSRRWDCHNPHLTERPPPIFC
jgi:hypothetical protein